MPRKQMKCNNEIQFRLRYFSLYQNKVYCAWQGTAREGKWSSSFSLRSGLHRSARRKMHFLEASYLPTKDKHRRSSNLVVSRVHSKGSPIPLAALQELLWATREVLVLGWHVPPGRPQKLRPPAANRRVTL